MMTDQERHTAFTEAINEAVRKYGYSIAAQLTHKEYAMMMQIEPQIVIVAVPGWTEPGVTEVKADEPSTSHSA